ncbi:hypothetical protein Q5752_004418 [Cryptotrichosporon argae]
MPPTPSHAIAFGILGIFLALLALATAVWFVSTCRAAQDAHGVRGAVARWKAVAGRGPRELPVPATHRRAGMPRTPRVAHTVALPVMEVPRKAEESRERERIADMRQLESARISEGA